MTLRIALVLLALSLVGCETPDSGRAAAPPTGPLSFDALLEVGVRFTSGETRDVVQLRRVEQGEVVWTTNTWIGYPRKSYHPYQTALVGDHAVLHVPNAAQHRYFKVDARTGGAAVEVNADDPIVKQADAGSLWSAERDMIVHPPQPPTSQGGE
jgi:hypothetical protein